MSAISSVARGRAAAEALMVDEGKALRPTGGFTYDPDTQQDIPAFDDLDSGICKLQDARGLEATATDVGGRTATTVRLDLHRPAASTPLTVGDEWEFTSVDPQSLAEVGDRYRVVAPFGKTLGTARRYQVERVVS